MTEIRYCGAGDRWSARAHLPGGGLQVEIGDSAAEAVYALLVRSGRDLGVTLVEYPKAPNSVTVHEDQALAVMVARWWPYGGSPRQVVGWIGAGAAAVLAILGTHDEDRLPFDFEKPTTPGLHVWEGRISVEGPAAFHQATWDGTWRPAARGDFARFGLATPGE